MKKVLLIAFLVLFLQGCDATVRCEEHYKVDDGVCVLKEYSVINFMLPTDMEPMDSLLVYEDEDIVLPEVNTEFTYDWYTDDTYTTVFDPDEILQADITLWLDLHTTFTVNFVVVEGLNPVPSQSVDYFDVASEPEFGFTRGITWYTDETLETSYKFYRPVVEDITLYMGLEPIEYMFKLYVEGRFYKTIQLDSIDDFLSIEPPVKDGEVWDQWYLDMDYEDALDLSTIDIDLYNPSINIYGRYVPRYRTISYVVDGDVIHTQDVQVGQSVDVYNPCSDEIVWFDGWYTSDSNIVVYDPITMPDEDVVVYGNRIDEATVYHTVEELHQTSNDGAIIQFEGIVSKIVGNYAHVTDGDKVMYISLVQFGTTCHVRTGREILTPLSYPWGTYTSISTIEDLDVGMRVDITGWYTTIDDISWINNVIEYEIVSTDNPVEINVIDTDIYQNADHMDFVEVTGTVLHRSSTAIYLDVDGEFIILKTQVVPYYIYVLEDWESYSDLQVGTIVTLQGFIKTMYYPYVLETIYDYEILYTDQLLQVRMEDTTIEDLRSRTNDQLEGSIVRLTGEFFYEDFVQICMEYVSNDCYTTREYGLQMDGYKIYFDYYSNQYLNNMNQLNYDLEELLGVDESGLVTVDLFVFGRQYNTSEERPNIGIYVGLFSELMVPDTTG